MGASLIRYVISLAALAGIAASAQAQENAEDLAKKLSNPIASLISVPFQGNYDGGYETMAANTPSTFNR